MPTVNPKKTDTRMDVQTHKAVCRWCGKKFETVIRNADWCARTDCTRRIALPEGKHHVKRKD